ncbi:MAG TPA: response regulator [Kofleriaceae bacterium]|nr:response regulator [Kofleriaceae bacterium]
MRVLVAEDDPAMLDAVASAIALGGAEVTRAVSGAEMVQELAEQPPFDLIVTDVSMPWMSGLQVALAARNAGHRTPIVVMTALRVPELARALERLGPDAVLLQKPFQLDDLQRAIAALLGPQRAP